MSFASYFALALAGTSLSVTALAQSTVQMVPRPTPDADALADAMRRLGSNPRDLASLITAAELSLKVGDVNGAAALLKRADEIDPMNGRVKAGMARILVSQERPGEALRYFDQAAGYGLDPRTFAGDRGLAYDLIGEQERAQRDYRVALRDGDQPEVQRRYALSLGISGRRDAALEEIDALLRKNDRGAWRARAFILAMNGDVAGAEKIATTMMPPGMAAGLQPFFTRLAALPAIDRAFAVHFGEVRATPQRVADRQLAPALPALGPEPGARPVQVAAATPVEQPAAKTDRRQSARDRRSARDRQTAREDRRDRTQVASVAPAPAAAAPVAATPDLPQPPSYAGNSIAFGPPREVAQQVAPSALRAPATDRAAQPVPPEELRVAAAETGTAPSARARTPGKAVSPAGTRVATAEASAAGRPAAPATSGLEGTRVARVDAASSPRSAAVRSVPGRPPSGFSSNGVVLPPARATAPQPDAGSPGATMPAVPKQAEVASAPVSAGATPSATVPAPLASTTPAMSEDTILAKIMAGISIPPSELSAAPISQPAPPASVVADAPARAAPGTAIATHASVASAEAARRAAASAAAAAQSGPEKPAPTRGAKAGAVAAKDSEDPKPGTRRTPAGRQAASKNATDDDAIPATRKAGTGGTAAGRQVASKDAAEEDATPAVRKAGARGAAAGREIAAKDAEPAPDPKIAARKAAADRKAAEAKKLADAKKAAEKKQAAAEAAAAKAEPARIWVQVAGGANEGDLPKAWNSVQGKAAALKGKAAYSTPLRATNRVVTGPFKTDAEARAFVNTLAKQGVSAFPFTSEKGQKMKKLGEK